MKTPPHPFTLAESSEGEANAMTTRLRHQGEKKPPTYPENQFHYYIEINKLIFEWDRKPQYRLKKILLASKGRTWSH